MSATDTVLLALTKHCHREPDPSAAAVDLLAQYDADRQAETLAETSDDARSCLQHALLFALNWHGTPAELHAGINKILITGSAAAPDFFQPRHTYRHTNSHGDTWEFRVVAVDRDPANTLQAIGWLTRVGSNVWHASCRGTHGWVSDDWADVTEGGERR